MGIHADRSVCIGSGNCVLAAADIFDQDEDALVVLLTDTPSADQEEAAREAVARCPSGALRLTEE
ncbi:ferredoxin [Kocuria rosea subsp. polaris]|uniref:Ferredoxin n=1 Tax=Kocuria rosea subsp. polaris TaxID=136273 RepID=A0A0W8IA64_KOCRO|nr:(4Fe-4S)-binding protein [Kocuria polaris]KUG56704.1 ferredoxin [Kocuria polaris]